MSANDEEELPWLRDRKGPDRGGRPRGSSLLGAASASNCSPRASAPRWLPAPRPRLACCLFSSRGCDRRPRFATSRAAPHAPWHGDTFSAARRCSAARELTCLSQPGVPLGATPTVVQFHSRSSRDGPGMGKSSLPMRRARAASSDRTQRRRLSSNSARRAEEDASDGRRMFEGWLDLVASADDRPSLRS